MAELATGTTAPLIARSDIVARDSTPPQYTFALTYPVVSHTVPRTKDVPEGYGKIFPLGYQALPDAFWRKIAKSIHDDVSAGNCSVHHHRVPGYMEAAWYSLNHTKQVYYDEDTPQSEECDAGLMSHKELLNIIGLCAKWLAGNHTVAGCCTFAYYEGDMPNYALDQHIKLSTLPVLHPVDGLKCNDTARTERLFDPEQITEVGAGV